MQPSTNGKHRLERYDHDDAAPTIKAPPLPPHSSYPPGARSIGFYEVFKVAKEMALTFAMFIYVCCTAVAFIYFKDNWYRDEASRVAVLEGLAILVTGLGTGIGIGRYKRKG